MIELKGINLGQRQQQLNEEVIKTTSENADFNLIKDLEETSDVDRLYKIDVASVYKNIDYIIETLKCGNSLYITRALKCSWIYENNYCLIISPDYLHNEIIPYMSNKMKNKLLVTISNHIRDENRAENFHKYCLTDNKFKNISEKFLIWTSEPYKMEFISSNNISDKSKIKQVIGNSFALADAYLAKEKSLNFDTSVLVHELCYLVKICPDKYLDMMETYTELNTECYYRRTLKLGLRLSKEIMSKHKERVVSNIELYFQKLNLGIIAKHSTVEEVKQYIAALLPNSATDFWSMNFYVCYKKIFDKLPQDELYSYLRQIFIAKYPNESFEMSRNFHNFEYYKFLTKEQQEMWALEHLKQNYEFFDQDNDYLWYQFVNYDKAFTEIKKLVNICTKGYQRTTMISVLIDSASNEEELIKLLNYYYDRHVNEIEDDKMLFIDNINEKTNVFKFGEKCWDAYYKIMCSTSIFSSNNFNLGNNKYKTIIIVYHVIHEKTIPVFLDDFVLTENNASNINYDKVILSKRLTDEQFHLVYQKLIELCENKLRKFDAESHKAIKKQARNIIDFAVSIIETFEKTKDDCPDIIHKYVKLDWKYYEGHDFFAIKKEKVTEAHLLKLLKLDAVLLLDKLPDIHSYTNSIRINNLLNKIKVYFSNDIAKTWLSHCESLLQRDEDKISFLRTYIFSVIIVIFHIGSDDYKISLVKKYVPEAKIDYVNIERKLLTIQESICRFAHCSRPNIPLKYILPYIKGDYVKYCLPMFGSYISKLPMPECIKFVSAILNAPVSVQKHGLRLAFRCFSDEDLTKTILTVWKSTKNISIRMTIYKALFEKVHQNPQPNVYEVLRTLTLDLNENDDEAVFSLLTCFKLSQFKSDFLETAWKSVQNLSELKSRNIQRKCMIINEITSNITIIGKKFCRAHILDDFVGAKLVEKNNEQNNDLKLLSDAKWKLAAKYLVYNDINEMDKSLELVRFILQTCTNLWFLTDNGVYTLRKFMFWFIDEIILCSNSKEIEANSVPVLDYILESLGILLPLGQFYTLYIKLNLIIISKKVMRSSKSNYMQLVPQSIAKEFAKAIIMFMNDLRVTNLLYMSFYDIIKSSLLNTIDIMCYDTNLINECFATLVSSQLIEIQRRRKTELPEAYIISVSILPKECPEHCSHVWQDVIKKIQSGNDYESIAYLYEHVLHTKYEAI